MSWLDTLERALVLGHRKTVVMVSDARVAGLRPLLRRLHGVAPGLVVALRADELPALADNSLVLLDTDLEDLAWLNANRSFVAHHCLRLVLWWPGAVATARTRAPDLLSWASKVIPCPQHPPPPAARAFEALREHRPGSIWPRALFRRCLDDLGEDALWLAPELGFDGLVESLRVFAGRVPVFEDVDTAAKRNLVSRALQAVAPAPVGPYVLVDAPPAAGWCVVETPESVAELAARLCNPRAPDAATKRLAAVLDGEAQAAALARGLLDAGDDADVLFVELLLVDDPLARLAAQSEAPRPCRLQPRRDWPTLEEPGEPRARIFVARDASPTLRSEDDMITWIHLSDIHAGQPGEATRAAVDLALRASIERLAERVGVPDLLLITGDLAFRGQAKEYARVEELVSRIEGWLGTELPVFSVPGNHDLARPKDLQYLVLKYYEHEPAVRERLWSGTPGWLSPLFAGYEGWLRSVVVPRARRVDHEIHWSERVPGDFCVVFQKGELRLGLVGLNSAWMQVDGGDYRGKLQLPAEQLHAALPAAAQPHDWFEGVDAAMLLTHHPRRWLSPRALEVYERDLHPPGRFDLALFGHMHEPESLLEARGGAAPRLYVQAPSLFGLERYGSKQESRSLGYAWGRIRADGELRLWPQVATRKQSGALVLDDDRSFDGWVDDVPGGVVLRPGRGPEPGTARVAMPRSPTSNAAPEVRALKRYLQALEQQHRSVRLLGFENRARVMLDLDEVEVPLEIVVDRRRRGDEVDDEVDDEDARGYAGLLAGGPHALPESLSLTQAFRRARQLRRSGLVVLGEPGAGKTTLLKQMLLQVVRHGPGSVGLPRELVPVFLPLRALSALPGGALDLTAFVRAQLGDTSVLGPDLARRLLGRGKLLLLIDGLDEVADADTRARVARWIEQTRTYMPDSYMLVSCRYAGYTAEVALGPEFLELHLRPLGDEQLQAFVRRWYAAVERELDDDEERAQHTATARAEELLTALGGSDVRSVARVYAMTRNPLLLTAICLVHRDHGHLPRTRGKLYGLCIQVLLERWRLGRDSMSLEPDQVQAVLQSVAAWMHGERERARARHAELLEPVQAALKRERGESMDAGEFLRLIRDDGGLLTGYGLDEYGFMHLGFQEFLTAQQLRNLHAEGRGGYEQLAASFDDSWWQEVILLLLAERNPSAFEPFMSALVRQPDFLGWWDSAMMRLCFDEAAEPSGAPFMAFLDQTEAGLAEGQIAAARLLLRELPELREGVDARLRGHATTALRSWWAGQAERRLSSIVKRGDRRVVEPAGIELVRIPAGRFCMGSPANEEGRFDHEGPQHEVELAEFWLARTPVTNAQYERYLEANPDAPMPAYWSDRNFNQPGQPVVGVSWDEVIRYCKWAGLAPPTEARWEYACRAGTTTRYWSGDAEADLARVGWYRGNSRRQLRPVAEKNANPWGLCDMHGNVWEWCYDQWGSYGTSPRVGDGLRHKPGVIGLPVFRGGGWAVEARYARSAMRGIAPRFTCTKFLGFRLAQG